jgi:predicted Zn-dependent protease
MGRHSVAPNNGAEIVRRAAQPRYNNPFKFCLVHESQPNAFATPGGNVYVVDSLLYFVKNSDELAGAIRHEVAHTIHDDTVTLMEKDGKLEKREVGAAILLGPTRAHILALCSSVSCIPSVITRRGIVSRYHRLRYMRQRSISPLGAAMAVPGF